MKQTAFIFLFLFFILNLNAAFAGLFRLESETISSVRENSLHQSENPIYELVSASYLNDQRNVEFNTYLNLFTDPSGRSTNKARLSIFELKVSDIWDRMNIRLGRTFDVQNTIGASAIDLLSLEFMFFEKKLLLGTFIGNEKKTDTVTDDPKSNVWGARIEYRSADLNPYFLTAKYMQRFYDNIQNLPSENLMEVGAKKVLPFGWSPEIIFDSQTNLTQNNLDRLEAGVDVYPTISTFGKVRVMTYNVLPNSGAEQPIYSIFSLGKLYEGRFQFEKKHSETLKTGISVFYDDFQLQENKRASGYGGELEARLHFDSVDLGNVIYTFISYGGVVYGDRINLQKRIGRSNELFGLVDVTYYEKVTSSKRYALGSDFGWNHFFGERLKLTLSAQANSNNALKEDFRAVGKLTYLLWDEI